MGKPSAGNAALSPVEHIDRAKTSGGSETSQYPEERKSKRDSLSSGERKGISPNLLRVSGHALRSGGCRAFVPSCDRLGGSYKVMW